MIIEIDQSGKIEDTASSTIIATSNGHIIEIKAKDKRYINLLFRRAGKPRRFIIELFSLGLALLIKKSFKKNIIYVIDLEYTGHEKDILITLSAFGRQMNITMTTDQIRFAKVGKKSMAHEYAHKVFTKKMKGEQISLKKLLQYLMK